eukprot:gene10189-12288_t
MLTAYIDGAASCKGDQRQYSALSASSSRSTSLDMRPGMPQTYTAAAASSTRTILLSSSSPFSGPRFLRPPTRNRRQLFSVLHSIAICMVSQHQLKVVDGGEHLRSPTGVGVPEIIRAVREKSTWKLPGKVLQPAPPPSLWTADSGAWAAPTVHSDGCPQRVPGLHSVPSIRSQVRLVFGDDGTCRAVGNVDAGVCVRKAPDAPIWCFPSFIIMGTGKGGTAELQSWLSHHPNLLRIGDPHSTSGGGEADYFGRELKTEAQLESTWRDYLHVWQPTNGSALEKQYAFEKSPGYLAHSTYPKLVQLLMPAVKMIAILRDPAKRAYSHFQMICTRENSKMTKFRVTKAEPQGREKEISVSGVFRDHHRKGRAMPYCTPDDFDNYVRKKGPAPGNMEVDGLFKTGLYADDLKRWWMIFPRSQILVLFNEHFVTDAVGMFDDVQSYLGVPHFNYSALVYKNAAGYTLLRGSASKADHKSHKSYLPMSAWSKSVLNDYYSNTTADLFGMLGPDNPGIQHARKKWGK